MENNKIVINEKDTKRIILVGDKIVFVMRNGSIKHCNGTNELMENICKKNTPVIASIKID